MITKSSARYGLTISIPDPVSLRVMIEFERSMQFWLGAVSKAIGDTSSTHSMLLIVNAVLWQMRWLLAYDVETQLSSKFVGAPVFNETSDPQPVIDWLIDTLFQDSRAATWASDTAQPIITAAREVSSD